MPNNAKTRFPTRRRLIGVAIAACFVSAPAWSNPTAPQVVNGAASFNQTGKLLTVTNSSGAIINWNSFSIGAGETTRFNQASAASSVLNRVIANDPSVLLGTLSSNGRVWLVNPAGIMVGQGARVDVAGFIASTLNVRNEDFLAGRLNFGATPNAGSIRNYGQITTPSGGSVFLVAPNVENHGIINAPNGEVLLAAGQTAQLIDTGTPGVKVDITGAEGNVTNLGEIVAEAGRIGMAGVLVKNSGALNASSLVREGGRVFLKAGKDAYVDAAGRIDTTGTRGGSIEVLGHRVAVMDQAQLDASGGTGGGTVLVGGDYQGKNPGVKNSSVTYFGPQASLKADALQLGDGGKVVVWADDSTRAFGTISARGGREGGNGGFVETSGHYLDVAGARVTAGAPNGQAGQWLLDPWDLTISNNSSMSPSVPTAGVFDADGSGSNVNSADVQSTLNGGTDVVITTGTGGPEAGNITVFGTSDSNGAVNIVKSAGGDRSLTLKAAGSIVLNPGAAISSTSGKLNITLNADWDGSDGGAIKMGSGSSLASLGGNLKLGGGTAGDGSGRAIGNATYIDGVYLTGATLDADGGNIALNGTGFAGTSLDSGVYVTDSSVIQTSGAGTITLSGTGGAGTADNNYGVVLGTFAALSSVNGAISITGVGAGSGGSNYGVYIHNGATVGATGSGTITLHGTGSAAGTTSNYGIRLSASTPGTQLTSASGAISMTGIGGTDGDGLQVTNGAKVQSGTGAITLDGTTGDGGSTNDGVYLTGAGTLVTSGGNIGITGTSISTVGTGNRGVAITSSAQVIATGAATITMTGQGGYDGDGLNIRSGSLVQSDTGLITLNGTSGNGTGPNGDGGVWLGEAGTLVTSGGGMTITGISTSTDSSNNNHGLNVSAGAKATTSAGLMTLNGTQGAGAISKAVGLSGTPTGGVVNAAAGLRINGTGDVVVDTGAVVNLGTGSADISATNNILFSASSSLAPSAGAFNIALHSDSDGTGGGGIYLDTGSSLNSNGGNITMGGMPSAGYAIGNGSVTGGITFNSGIYVLGDITAGAGDVTLRGEGASNNLADGITFAGGTLSGNGVVNIDGIAHGYSTGTTLTPNRFAAGVDFLNAGTRLTTQTGTVTVTGLNTAPNADPSYYRADGIMVETDTVVQTTGTGTLTFNGTANSFNTSWGLGVVNGTIQTTAPGGGAITLNGTNASSNADGGVVILGGHVLSSGGEIRMVGAGLGGSVGIANGSFASWYGSTIGGAASGNILIKANNPGSVILESDSWIDAGANTLTLSLAGGAVTNNNPSDNSIRAGALRLLGTGTFNLGTVPAYLNGNNVGTLAANVTGNVNYNGISGFAIGSVTSFDGTGVTTTTGVTTGNGNFTAIANNGGTPGNLTLNAGSAIDTGSGALSLSAVGGNLNINGDVSAGTLALNGGTWNQVSATLPGLSVNDFRITGGTFIRALGGDGATSTPYQLADIYGVQGVGSSGMLGNSYVLANTIEAAGTANWNSGAGFAPVGTFTGQFDGQSYAINNLTINRPSDDYVGLFGYVGYGGLVKNIGLVGGSVTGNDYVGGLVGENSGSVSDAYNTGAVIGNGDKIGGLVGRNRSDNGDGTISNSHSTGPVNGNDRVGGLVGYNTGEITNSYSTSEVQGSNSIGGLVGRNSDVGSVSNAYSTGAVSGNDSVGGLVGENSGSISNAYSTGVVTGDVSVGGLVGDNDTGSNSDTGSIVDSHATGLVRGNGNNAGGLVGSNVGSISNAYATGDVDGSYDGGINNVGGLVGYNNQGSIDNAYATGSVSGRDRVGGLVGYNDYGFVRTSYATGNVSGDDRVGGLVGYNENDGGPSIDNTYASGSVTGRNEVGGLVGFNYGADIKDSYSNGLVTGTGYYDVGGLVGDGAYGTVINSYWDTETSGRSFSNGGGIGMTTAQMMQSVNFSSSTAANSFDSPEWGGEWRFIDGIAYPYLQWRFPTAPQIVSGTLNGDSGGAAIQTAQNGNLLRTSTTGANGFYYQALDAGSVGNGSALLAYRANSAGDAAVAVRLADGGHLTGVDLLANNVIASSSGAAAVSNGTLAAAIGSLSSSDIPYGVSANNFTLDPGIGFRTALGSSYTLDGNVSTSGGASQFWYGPVTLPTTATLSAAGGGITLTNQTSQLSGLNVVADALTIEAANGVGTAATPLTTQVNSLNVLNTTSGGIFVKNIGAQPASVVLADNAATGAVVSFLNTGDITSTSGFTLMTLNGGDLALLSNGNLTWNGGNLATPSGGVLISADGSVSVSGALSSPVDLALSSVIAINVDASGSVSTGGTGTASFIAPSVAINGAVNAADDVGIIANTLNLGDGSSTGAGHDVIFAAANVTATNASVTAGHDISAAVTGDLRLNGSGFTAANDIFIDLMGASSTLYLNDAALLPRSYLWAKAPATIHLDYPARAAGGMVVNGVAEDPLTFEAAAGASGLFYGAGMTPAPFGTGLDVTYGMGSTSAAPTVLDAVQAAIRVSTAPPSDSVDADGRPKKRGGKPGMAKFATCGKPGE